MDFRGPALKKPTFFGISSMVRLYPNRLIRQPDEWLHRPLSNEEGQPWQRRKRAHLQP